MAICFFFFARNEFQIGGIIMDLKAALEEYKPTIEDRYKSYVTSMLENLKKLFGPKLQGVANSKYYSVYESIRGNIKLVKENENDYRPSAIGEYFIDEDRINRGATLYAERTIESWLGKIQSKMGDLADAKVHRLNDMRFEIEGARNGRSVRIDQDMIINQSSKGKLFNQFPARIYVDGKFFSEAKYKELWADEESKEVKKPSRPKMGM
jgi:hypothetical protein